MNDDASIQEIKPRIRRLDRIAAWEYAFVRRLHLVTLPTFLHRLLVVFVRVGDGWGWAVIAAVLFLVQPWDRFKFIVGQALLAVAISLPIYWAFKFAFRRQRPYKSVSGISARVPPLDKYSFPSGHTMNNLAVAMTLALNIPHLWPLAIAVPLSLGLLRIFFGVHFLTDIAAGALLGALSALGAHSLFPHLFPNLLFLRNSPIRACFFFAWVLGAGFTLGIAAESDTISSAADSTGKSQTGAVLKDTSTGARIYEYIAHPALQILTLPVEKVLVPAVSVLIYPTKEPIRYVLNEDIIDRTISIVTYGDRQQIQAYPTLNLAPGTGSRTGATFRDKALFGRNTEQLVSYLLYYVNGDYKARAYVTGDKLLGSDLSTKIGVTVTHMKNASVNEPGTDYFLFYSDTSEQYQFQLSYATLFNTQLRVAFNPRFNHFGNAPPNLLNSDTLAGTFFINKKTGLQDREYRGLDQSFLDRQWEIGVTRDTRNNPNITLNGSWLDATLRYHDADLGHSFYEWMGQYATYFQLGKEKYEITPEEERRNGKLNVEKIMQQLDYEKIREGIFSRKVLVLHFYAAQSYEIDDNSMPIYGLQTLGNDTPLRGYPGSRFRDYTVAAVSTEYRFPVIRIMDGDIFDEYGVTGRNWQRIDYLDYKNTWGFGIRVRRPDIFLFRLELGIHGVSGAVFNMSVDAPF